jgi:hypothetical protein
VLELTVGEERDFAAHEPQLLAAVKLDLRHDSEARRRRSRAG